MALVTLVLAPECYHWRESYGLHQQETFVMGGHSSPRVRDKELLKYPNASDPLAEKLKDTLNTKAPGFILLATPCSKTSLIAVRMLLTKLLLEETLTPLRRLTSNLQQTSVKRWSSE